MLGPVGNQVIFCFALGPGKTPLTTGPRRQAGRLGRLFPGTDWARNCVMAPPLLSTGLSLGGIGIDLIRWRRRSNIPTIIPVASAIRRRWLLSNVPEAWQAAPAPCLFRCSSLPQWESVQELAGALPALVLCGSGSSSSDPIAGFPSRARVRAKLLSGWLAKRFTYQVSGRAGAPTGQPTSADTGQKPFRIGATPNGR